jgi:hypothetical protein
MAPVLSRLFLLLLLACDWAADPSRLPPAVRALSAPLSSTECFCHSLAHRAEIGWGCAPDRCPRAAAPAACPDPPSASPVPQEADPVPLPGSALVYALMSLRR